MLMSFAGRGWSLYLKVKARWLARWEGPWTFRPLKCELDFAGHEPPVEDLHFSRRPSRDPQTVKHWKMAEAMRENTDAVQLQVAVKIELKGLNGRMTVLLG